MIWRRYDDDVKTIWWWWGETIWRQFKDDMMMISTETPSIPSAKTASETEILLKSYLRESHVKFLSLLASTLKCAFLQSLFVHCQLALVLSCHMQSLFVHCQLTPGDPLVLCSWPGRVLATWGWTEGLSLKGFGTSCKWVNPKMLGSPMDENCLEFVIFSGLVCFSLLHRKW